MNSQFPSAPFTNQDLAQLGISRQQLRSGLQSGELRRVTLNVYVASSVPDTIELRAACLALVTRPEVVVCDWSAAWLWGVDAYDPGEDANAAPLSVVTSGRGSRVRRPGFDGAKRDLSDDDIVTVGTVRVTTPARTALDLACLRGRGSSLAILDAFMRVQGVTQEEFQVLLIRYKRRRGVVQLRELVPIASPLPESMGESFTRGTIYDAGLGVPTPQVWIDVPGYGRVRGDLVYERERIVVEYDGVEFHSSPADREHDERRRAALRAAGWIVIVVRKEDLGGAARERWIAELAEALRQRAEPAVPSRRRVYPRGRDLAGAPRRRRRT
jgi:hypothetical protein